MLNSFKKNWFVWFGVISGSASIVSLALTFYGFPSHKEREPIFVETNRTILIDSDYAEDAPIKILDKQNEEVKGNVIALQFAFWNRGSEPIRFNEHVLAYGDAQKPSITLSFIEDGTRILAQPSCLRQSRPEVRLDLKETGSKSVDLSFNILDENDGGVCQIIFEGEKTAQLEIYGAIEGVPEGFNAEVSKQKLFSIWSKLISWTSFFATSYIILLLFIMFQFWGSKESYGERKHNAAVLLYTLLLLISIFGVTEILKSESLQEVIPETIRSKKILG